MSCGNNLSKLNSQDKLSEDKSFFNSFPKTVELPLYEEIFNMFPILYNFRITQYLRIIFTNNGKLVPYIQFNNDFNEEVIGFLWNIPEETFNEILIYIKKYHNKSNFRFYIPLIQPKLIQFFISESLLIKSEIFRHEFEITKLNEIADTDNQFFTRIANENDIELLLELISDDRRINKFFSKKEHYIKYLRHELIPLRKTVLIFNNNQLICAALPELSDRNYEVILKFYAMRSGFEHSWRSLLINITKLCKVNGWKNKRLIIYLRGMRYYQSFTKLLEEFNPHSSVEGFLFSLNQ